MESRTFHLVGAGTDSPFGGYVTATDRTVLSRRFLVRGSKNVYLKDNGAVSVRPGLKRRGSADSTMAGTKASFEWDNSLGRTLALRVNDGKLQVESDIVTSGTYVWYNLLTGLTNTRLIFAPWWDNSAKKDILLFCDGTTSMKSWSGGIGLIASTTATTIVLTASAASLGFASSGTVIINGTEYTYSGVSSDTLTGVSGTPTGEANGSVVLQKPVTDADTVASDYEIDFIRVIKNQLYVGSDTSRLVYLSKNTDWDDFSFSSPRITGEGDVLTLDEFPTGIGEVKGTPVIGTKRAWYEISFKQITVGTTLSEQTEVNKRPVALKKGLLRHEFFDTVDNDAVYLGQDHQLYRYGDFQNFQDVRIPSLSRQIAPELTQEDFTGGHLKVAGDFIYITAPNTGRVWLFEQQTVVGPQGDLQQNLIWHPPFVWNISRIAVINDTEYGHSNANPQLYQLWDTLQWHDDSPSDESIPYDCVAAFAYRQADRYNLVTFDQVYFEGKMTPGTELEGAVVYEYQGEQAVQQITLNGPDNAAEFYLGDIGVALGDASLGDNPLGDQTSEVEIEEELTPKFRVTPDVGEQNVHEYQVRLFSSEPGSRWELFCFGANDQVSEELPTDLRR